MRERGSEGSDNRGKDNVLKKSKRDSYLVDSWKFEVEKNVSSNIEA